MITYEVMPEEITKINLEKISVPVEGMTCASCVARVEKSIAKINGVTEVSVNLATEKATFKIDQSKTGIEEIKNSVEEAGYKIDFSSLNQTEEAEDIRRPTERAGRPFQAGRSSGNHAPGQGPRVRSGNHRGCKRRDRALQQGCGQQGSGQPQVPHECVDRRAVR